MIWDIKVILKIGLISILAGMLSSSIGVTSFWLYYEAMETQDKTPIEAQLTTIVLVMLGSLVTSAQYYYANVIALDYLELFTFLIIVGAFLGLMLKR